jgi:phosphatidylinositol alpha-mannosyltransferase
MRVGLICPYSLTVPGGVQGQVLGLARALRAKGHEVRVLAPTDGPPPEPWITSLGPSMLSPSNGSVAPVAPHPPTQVRAIRALWEENFDVLHVHEPLCAGPSVTAVVMKTAPMIGTFHAAGEQPAYKYLAWLARKMARRLEVKVAVSDDAKALVEDVIPGEWQVLFNGVEVDRFEVDPWERPDDRRVVLFVGRHDERKGLAVLLDAVSHLPDDVVVWVAGAGPETERLRAKYRQNRRIEWLGRVTDSERNRRMVAADVFVAPSLGGESFGVILLEAMAAGTPVVASDISGYARVAGPLPDDPRHTALLTPAGDSSALASAIREVLNTPDLAGALAAAGRQRAQHFSMDRLAETYLALYRRLAPVDSRP